MAAIVNKLVYMTALRTHSGAQAAVDTRGVYCEATEALLNTLAKNIGSRQREWLEKCLREKPKVWVEEFRCMVDGMCMAYKRGVYERVLPLKAERDGYKSCRFLPVWPRCSYNGRRAYACAPLTNYGPGYGFFF